MSNDQRNTLLISGLSIIIGLIVGMFIPRFIDLAHRERERGDAIRLEREFFPQGDRLAYRIFRLIHPDSIQAGKIKEVIDRADLRIRDIDERVRNEKMIVMDTLKKQLKPFLSEEQFKRLDEVRRPRRRR